MSTSTTAQATTGSISMGITDFEMPGMEGDMGGQMKSMMSSMEMTMHFKPGHQVTDINMMGMMNMKQYYHNDIMTQYMDMMGQKIMIKTPVNQQLEQMKELGIDIENLEEMYKITYDKTTIKTIMGYDCYKATINMDLEMMSQGQKMPEGMKDMEMIMYITEDIKMESFNLQNIPGLKMKGTPLSFTIDMGMMKMTYEATNFNKNPDPSVFEKPKGDYKEMSLEDLQKMGMGAGGFGF